MKRKGGHYRYIRRDRFGRFNKRGRTRQRIWIPPYKKRKRFPVPRYPKLPYPRPRRRPEKDRSWHIRVDYAGGKARKGGKHPILIDIKFTSKKPVGAAEVRTHIENTASGLPLPKGMRIDAINWTHKTGPKAGYIKGSERDLGALSPVIFNPEEFRVEREE